MSLLFEEKQKFTQWWLWLILLFFPIILAGPFDENEINWYYVLIVTAILILFYFFELRIKVTEDGLYYQFFPFHLKFHMIRLDEIESFKAMKYSPLKEYGGWGIKYRFKGRAFNVIGNKGVKIFLKNGTNIMFGSQKDKEMEKALKKIKRQ